MRTILSLFILIASYGCQEQTDTPLKYHTGAIIGGYNTKLSPYPWQVSIRDERGEHFCGGSIISKRVIITAAHCLDHIKPEHVQVAGGGSSGRLHEQRLLPPVREVIVHPDWTGGYTELVNNDIALLKLERDIVFDQHLKPVALPGSDDVSFSIARYFSQMHDAIVTSGWGATHTDSQDKQQLKYYQVTPLASTLDFDFWTQDASYHYIKVDLGRRMIGGNFLVTFTPGKSTCNGDSGGPLVGMVGSIFQRPILLGLTSAGGDISCNSSVFHTDVQHYLPWINSHLR